MHAHRILTTTGELANIGELLCSPVPYSIDTPERTVLQALIPNRDGPTQGALRFHSARRP